MPERARGELVPALRALSDWLSDDGIPGTVIGGVAASLLARPRFTRDVDVLIDLPENSWEGALRSASRHGLEPRVPDPLSVARRLRVLLLRHVYSSIDVDVIVGGLDFEREIISRAVTVEVANFTIRVPVVEDLTIMKAIAGRPQDLLDVEGLLCAHPNMDQRRVRDFVAEFAAAATLPTLLEEFDRVVERTRTTL
jgi:hypothetical protein